MSADSIEINKNKLIAITVSIIVFCSLVFFLLLYSILSPSNSVNEGGSIEIGFSGTEKNDIDHSFNSENHQAISANEKNEINKSTGNIPANEKTSAELLRDQFFENKEKTSTGSDKKPGDEKSVDHIGNNYKNSNGFITSANVINGPLTINLTGRKIEVQPTLSKDTKEEGKVVVEITVDKSGKVIKADPNGRGTTTSSSVLKEKAKLTALTTLFSASNLEEQKGIITIIFSF